MGTTLMISDCLKYEIILNTVFSGGAYTFLLNKSKIEPVLIVDVVDWQNIIKAEFIYQERNEILNFDSLDDLFDKLNLSAISINHLIGSLDIDELLKKLLNLCKGLALTIYVHDFYSVCPTVNLLNYDSEYCHLPSISDCNSCLRKYPISNNAFYFAQQEVEKVYKIHKGKIENWRQLWYPIFEHADKIIIPSKSAADIWLRIYNKFEEKITILHHDLSYLNDITPKGKIERGPFFDVYIIGEINVHKGSKIVHQILEYIKTFKLNICLNVLGEYIDQDFINTPYLRLHGRFKNTEIAYILNNNNIDCFLMTSICPETFSYTVQEMMKTGLPIISFNLGAQGEFISKYQHGEVIDIVSAKTMFEKLHSRYEASLNKLYPILLSDLLPEVRNEFNALIRTINDLQLEVVNNELYRRSKFTELNNEVARLKNEQLITYTELNNEIARLKNEQLIIYNSKSWLITKPFRKFKELIRLFAT